MRCLSGLCAFILIAASCPAQAQSAANLKALQGLAPFSTLLNTDAGKAALAANYKITGAIETGTAIQPALQPFAAQQGQALRDAFITFGNGTQLADGLGTKLGSTYQKLAVYTQSNGKVSFTNISPNVAQLLIYSVIVAELDSETAKYVFANGTIKSLDGKKMPASAAAMGILKTSDGTTDVFGKAYADPAGAKRADPLGNSRPFQTEKPFTTYNGLDYFGAASSNTDWLYGPAPGASKIAGTDLVASPAFPSGHTVYGYTEATLLAIMVPARYSQEITRAAEYGNSRIVLGAHYAIDIIGGRTLAYYDLAQMLAGNPQYLDQDTGKIKPISNYGLALATARADLVKALETATLERIDTAAKDDTSRFANPAVNEAFYESTQTYGLPVVFAAQAGKTEDVAKIAPEAGRLLTAAFPYLTLQQADEILTATEGPGGGFLDNGSAFGLYSRLDLYRAGLKAAALAPKS